ncbi:hypothetical protein ACROYT_G043984 [Oculina patagonica]
MRRRMLDAIQGQLEMWKYALKQEDFAPGNEEAIANRMLDPTTDNPFDLNHVIPAGGALQLIRRWLNSLELQPNQLTQPQEPTSPPPEMDSLVTLDNLMKVFHHGEGRLEDTYRLSVTSNPDDAYARERLAGVFVELGAEETEAVPFHLLYQHPIIQDCMHICQRFKTLDLRNSFKSSSMDSFE